MNRKMFGRYLMKIFVNTKTNFQLRTAIYLSSVIFSGLLQFTLLVNGVTFNLTTTSPVFTVGYIVTAKCVISGIRAIEVEWNFSRVSSFSH